ncbi:hypothetical protein LX32DRAFT_664268 [Colletotrichum zoysiae]|uniref:Major facilitator superfamily transporter n=1 Tax=Colletotrichum zoysiae TaxID=1216348 RepID=A0AAD9HH47_9PEZI|nr:hypothetical protein LX32DRAFT_664268 [Colletotrichum zoysiae]
MSGSKVFFRFLDEATESFTKLSKSRSLLLTALISTAGLLTVPIGIPPARQQVVVSIYNVSTGRLMLLWVRPADVYRRRFVFLVGSVLFTLSNMCLPFTGYEGMGGAAVIPSGIGIIASTFPRGNARNGAYVCVSADASAASVLGNIFGGVIGGMLSCQWVLWIPAILAAVTTTAAYFITDTPHFRSSPSAGTSEANSVVGALLSCCLVLLLAVFTQANAISWSTPWITPLIPGTAVLLIGFCFLKGSLVNDPAGEPLMRISMLKDLQFSALYHDYLNLSELDTTLRFLPAGIAGFCGVASPFIMAIPVIPPETTYWAYGFPAMYLCFSIKSSSNNVGRALGLTIATAIQTSVQGFDGDSGRFAGSSRFLYGVRAAQ